MRLFFKQKSDIPRRRAAAPGEPRTAKPADLQAYAFRRNRTLAGSTSSDITTSGDNQYATLTSARTQLHQLVQKRRRMGFLLMGSIVASALLYSFLTQIIATVAVRPAGEVSIQLDDYQPAIQRYFADHPLQRLRFMTDTAQLTEYLNHTHPEVLRAGLGASLGIGASEIIVTPRVPIAGWSIGGRQHYVDGSGVAFTRSYSKEPPIQIIDQSGLQIATGQAVASNRFLGFVGRTVSLADTNGYPVTKVIIPRATARQIELQVRGVPYPVKLSIDRPAGEQVEDMTRAIEWMKKKALTPKYIDVRVSNRAFYR